MPWNTKHTWVREPSGHIVSLTKSCRCVFFLGRRSELDKKSMRSYLKVRYVFSSDSKDSLVNVMLLDVRTWFYLTFVLFLVMDALLGEGNVFVVLYGWNTGQYVADCMKIDMFVAWPDCDSLKSKKKLGCRPFSWTV